MKLTRRSLLAGLSSTLVVGCGGPSPITDWTLRPASERGRRELEWLKANYTFSFSKYRNPAYQRFRSLRVMNNDVIAPRGGFPMHGHRDMEIVTWVLDGALEHADNLGNGAVIEPGILQRMSAGTGIRHSEFNPSRFSSTELYQIWLTPDATGHEPGYAEAPLAENPAGALPVVASGRGAAGAISIHADADIYAGPLARGTTVTLRQAPGRATWVQVARGEVRLNGRRLQQGDGAHSESPGRVELSADTDAELLVFDLA